MLACLCQAQEGGNPLSPNDCCDIYTDDINCVCQNQTNSITTGQNCCAATKFADDKACICADQTEDPLTPTNCCDQPQWAGNLECTCQNVTLPIFGNVNCCSLAEYENNQQCLCESNWNPTTCCNYPNFADNHECICLQQTGSASTPEACCDVAPWNNTPTCQCPAQDNAYTPVKCCNYAPWNTSHDCQCDLQTGPITANLNCCDTTRFENCTTCLCYAQDLSTEPLNCCNSPNFAGDLECACLNQHALPIFNGTNCCSLASHAQDTLCQCQVNFVPETCCSFDQFADNTECLCLADYGDGNDNNTVLPITECCGMSEFQDRTECLCVQDFTVQPCCDISLFHNNSACACHNQVDAFTPNNCCNDITWSNTRDCICYEAPDHSAVQTDGSDCCDLYPDDENCICKYQSVAISASGSNCCAYSQFSDEPVCQCANQTAPRTPVECCDVEARFQDNLECQCRNVVLPFTPSLNCCSLAAYEDTVQCQCFVDFDATQCCGYDEWSDTHVCTCLAQNNSNTPENCCDQPEWSNDHYCNCGIQLQDGGSPLTPLSCCDYSDDTANSHLCLCNSPSQTGPNTPNACCDTARWENSTECQCAIQTDSVSPINCCAYRPASDHECYCQGLTSGFSTGSFNCCTLNAYETQPECQCFDDFDTTDCCIFSAFSGNHACQCVAQNAAITPQLNCCDQPAWTGSHECYCSTQDVNNPPQECCDLAPFTTTPQCECWQQGKPDGNLQCCNVVDNYNSYPECYCANLTNPTQNSTCCTLSPYSTSEDCICLFSQTEAIVNGNDCCNYSNFANDPVCVCEAQTDPHVPCLCYSADTFDVTPCCEYLEFENDLRCGGLIVPDCADRMDYHNQPNAECCALAQYISYASCCAFQSEPIGPNYNCCSSAKFSNTLECLCLSQTDALTPNDCCAYSNFANSFECICDAQTVAIDYTQDPPFSCCNQTKFANDPNCLCAAQIASTGSFLTPQYCCNLAHYANDHECVCAQQSSPTTPVACCDSTTFENNPQCICAAQQDTSLTTPYNCCTIAQYMSELECQCQSQTNALSPQNCCATQKFENDPACTCTTNFDLDTCCAVYPTDPRCECQNNFEIPKCCAYNPSHTGCPLGTTDCYSNDTHLDDYQEPSNYNYSSTDNVITIVEGLIFFNPLIQNNYQTVQVLSETNPVTVKETACSANGLSATDASNTIYSPELPWAGTFSVNVLFDRDACDEDVEITVYSTAYFAVTAVLAEEAASVQWNVLDTSGNVVASVEADVQNPNSNFWPQLTDDDRDDFFNSYVPQKVELGFNGRDCWLSIVGTNNQVSESGVWGCLIPTTESCVDIGSNDDIEIRNHFGTFTLGYNALTNAANPKGALYISYAYLVAGGDQTLGVLAQEIAAAAYNPDVQISASDDVTCVVTFDWGRVSLLPAGSSCQTVNAASQYGSFQAVQYSHSLQYIPQYQYCGTVTPIADDVAIKSHICSECGSLIVGTPAVNAAGSTTSLSLIDFVVLAASYEEYNPTVVINSRSDADLYLVADHESGIRTVVAPTVSGGLQSIASINIQFTLAVVSFPADVLNAVNANPLAEIVLNIRPFGQQTVSIVFYVNRTGKIKPSLT